MAGIGIDVHALGTTARLACLATCRTALDGGFCGACLTGPSAAVLACGALVVAASTVAWAGVGIDAGVAASGFVGWADALAFAASLPCGALVVATPAVIGVILEVKAAFVTCCECTIGAFSLAGAIDTDFAAGTGIVACATVPCIGFVIDTDAIADDAGSFALACAVDAAFITFASIVAGTAMVVISERIDTDAPTGELFAASEFTLSIDATFSGFAESSTSATVESILCEVGTEAVAARFVVAAGALSFVAVFATATALPTGAAVPVGGVGVKAAASAFGGGGCGACCSAFSGDADIAGDADGVACSAMDGIGLWVDAFVVAP